MSPTNMMIASDRTSGSSCDKGGCVVVHTAYSNTLWRSVWLVCSAYMEMDEPVASRGNFVALLKGKYQSLLIPSYIPHDGIDGEISILRARTTGAMAIHGLFPALK